MLLSNWSGTSSFVYALRAILSAGGPYELLCFYYFQAFINKLKDLKKDVKDLEFRVDQLKERPEALEALRQMLNHSTYFLKSIQNLSALELQEDPIFTAVEVETLAKLINETQVSQATYTPSISENKSGSIQVAK